MDEIDSEKFWEHVERTSDCWVWKGRKNNPKRYGLFYLKGKHVPAHRLSYEEAYGPIPAGMYIDHLCRNRRCVKPSHLEAVTPRINAIRRIEHSSYDPISDYGLNYLDWKD